MVKTENYFIFGTNGPVVVLRLLGQITQTIVTTITTRASSRRTHRFPSTAITFLRTTRRWTRTARARHPCLRRPCTTLSRQKSKYLRHQTTVNSNTDIIQIKYKIISWCDIDNHIEWIIMNNANVLLLLLFQWSSARLRDRLNTCPIIGNRGLRRSETVYWGLQNSTDVNLKVIMRFCDAHALNMI